MIKPLDADALPSHAELIRAAERTAVRLVPELLRTPMPSLEKARGERQLRLEALGSTTAELGAWVQLGYDLEVTNVAAFRENEAAAHGLRQKEGLAPAGGISPYLGVSPWTRGVLGESNTQALLLNAEELRGKATIDPWALALPLSSPESAIAEQSMRLWFASEAIAADHAFQLRLLIDSAPSLARTFGTGATIGGSVAPPTVVHQVRMGQGLQADLSRCSDRAASLLSACDDATLSYLAEVTSDAWSEPSFDPEVARQRAVLERDLDGALSTGLAAAQRLGAGGSDRDRLVVERTQVKLREIEERLAELPAGDPEVMVREKLVEAVAHDAAQLTRANKAIETSFSQDGPGTDPGLDLGPGM